MATTWASSPRGRGRKPRRLGRPQTHTQTRHNTHRCTRAWVDVRMPCGVTQAQVLPASRAQNGSNARNPSLARWVVTSGPTAWMMEQTIWGHTPSRDISRVCLRTRLTVVSRCGMGPYQTKALVSSPGTTAHRRPNSISGAGATHGCCPMGRVNSRRRYWMDNDARSR